MIYNDFFLQKKEKNEKTQDFMQIKKNKTKNTKI